MSTIKVTNIEHGSTTDGGIQLDSSGHVTVDGVQFPTSGALANRNLVINGAMNVAQRGTSSTSGGYSTVDRIKVATSDTNTQSQESLSSSDTPYSHGFRNYYRLKNTTASGGGASTYREIDYRVEAQDIASSGWDYTSTSSYITLQFWLRASVSQSYYLNVRSQDGTQRAFISELAVTADTWKKFEITIPGNSGITLSNDNGLGLLVRFIPWYGTTYTGSGSTGAWVTSSNDMIPDMTDTWGETANATFDLTGLQLEVGEKATPFEHRLYADELARCQRYYYRAVDGAYDSNHIVCSGAWYNTTQLYGVIDFPVEMRTTPTLSYSSNSNTSAFRVFTAGNFSSTDDIGTQQTGRSRYGIYFYNLSPTRTAGNAGWAELENESGAYIAFDAEL